VVPDYFKGYSGAIIGNNALAATLGFSISFLDEIESDPDIFILIV
jgi:hypothetical protein